MGSKPPKPADNLRVTPLPRLSSVNIDELHKTLSKLASAVNRSAKHTEQIPEIKYKIDKTSEKVVELSTKVSGMDNRVNKIEGKVDRGHDCYQIDVLSVLRDDQRSIVQKVEKDIHNGIQWATELTGLKKDAAETEADVEDIKKAPRRLFYGLLGVILTIITGALGAAWFLAELGKDVEFERQQRTEQFKRIEVQIESVSKKADNTAVRKAIMELEDELELSNGHKARYSTLCEEMTPYERRFVKGLLTKRGRIIPESCLE